MGSVPQVAGADVTGSIQLHTATFNIRELLGEYQLILASLSLNMAWTAATPGLSTVLP
jgi:hypothetical protein